MLGNMGNVCVVWVLTVIRIENLVHGGVAVVVVGENRLVIQNTRLVSHLSSTLCRLTEYMSGHLLICHMVLCPYVDQTLSRL